MAAPAASHNGAATAAATPIPACFMRNITVLYSLRFSEKYTSPRRFGAEKSNVAARASA
jgi:hypothetical protein